MKGSEQFAGMQLEPLSAAAAALPAHFCYSKCWQGWPHFFFPSSHPRALPEKLLLWHFWPICSSEACGNINQSSLFWARIALSTLMSPACAPQDPSWLQAPWLAHRVGCGSSAPHSPHHTGHIESAPAISVWFIISPALAQGLSPAPAAPAGREKRQPPTLPGINLFSPRLKLGYLGPNSFSSVNWQSFIAFRKGSWPFAFIPSDGQLIAWHSLKIGTDGSSTGELLLLISAALRREGADFQRQSCAELRQSNPAVSCRGQPGFTQIYSMHGWMKGGTSEEQSYCAWHNQREVTGINHNLHYYL